MNSRRRINKADKLDVDIDTRISLLWQRAYEIEEWTLEAVGAFMRAAYGKGYVDAHQEARDGNPAKLAIDNDYRLFKQQ